MITLEDARNLRALRAWPERMNSIDISSSWYCKVKIIATTPLRWPYRCHIPLSQIDIFGVKQNRVTLSLSTKEGIIMSRRMVHEMTTNDGSAQQTEAGPDQNRLETLAYEHWLARGCPDGSPEVDWLRAEQDLRGRTEFVSRAA